MGRGTLSNNALKLTKRDILSVDALRASSSLSRASQLSAVFSDSSPKAHLSHSHVETQMMAWAKGHAALPPDAGFSNNHPAVARVQSSNSAAMERASDRIIRAATSASCPLHASAERAPLFPGAGSLVTAEGSVQRWKRQGWRSGAGVVGRVA
jgi:hypothetical protein